MFSPKNKEYCISKRNVLCKSIYAAIFNFIMHKLQNALDPNAQIVTASRIKIDLDATYSSINILDIFGF